MLGKTRFLSAIESFTTRGEEKTDTFGSILRPSAIKNRWKILHWMKPNAMSMLTVSLRHEVQSLQSTIEQFRLANVLPRCSLQSMCDFVHWQKSVDPNSKSSTTYRHGIANRSKALKCLQHSCTWASLNAEVLLHSMILKNQCPPEPNQQILYTDNLTFKLANTCHSQSSDVKVVLSNTTPILVASSPHCLIYVLVPLCYFWSKVTYLKPVHCLSTDDLH